MTASVKTAPTAKSTVRQAIPEPTMMNLLSEALNSPGKLGNTYNLFYEYSFMNQIWLMIQGVDEPCGPFGFWKTKFNRYAKKGTAKTVLHPVFVPKKNRETGELILKDGKKQMILVAFKAKATVFKYSDTTGEDVEWPTLPDWNLEMACAALEIQQERFKLADGNTQGYSYDHKFAINPVARHPWKTTFHELAHIVLGHTDKTEHTEHDHRGIKEFQAEAVAYLLAHELELTDWDAAESRAYIQGWLDGTGERDNVTDSHIRAIFGAVNRILKAGRPARATEEE
jgi:hypothetical protein